MERRMRPPLPRFARDARFKGLQNLGEALFDHGRAVWGAPGELEVSAALRLYGGRPRKRCRPKSYLRPDDGIREEIYARLHSDRELRRTEIEVEVSQGAVILSGRVPARWQRFRAEQLCQAVDGVRDIQNALRVSGVRDG